MGEQREMFAAPQGWERLSVAGDKIGARWRHPSGWEIRHCGHPTANFPYLVVDPASPDRLIVAANGRGFRTLDLARAAVEQVVDGTAVVCEGPRSLRFGRCWRIVPPGEAEALARARVELDGPAWSATNGGAS